NLLDERCEMLYLSRRYAEAERECSKVLEIDPVFRFSRETLLKIRARLGDHGWIADHVGGDDAAPEYKAPPDSPARIGLRHEGPAGMWRALAAQVEQSGGNFFGLAGYYVELGETEKALRALSEAVAKHEFRVVYACVDPLFDPLRSDSRFDAVLQKVCGSQR